MFYLKIILNLIILVVYHSDTKIFDIVIRL